MEKDILIDAIKGLEPGYALITKYEELGLGKYYGGFKDSWDWDNDIKNRLQKYSIETLTSLYNELKNQYNND